MDKESKNSIGNSTNDRERPAKGNELLGKLLKTRQPMAPDRKLPAKRRSLSEQITLRGAYDTVIQESCNHFKSGGTQFCRTHKEYRP